MEIAFQAWSETFGSELHGDKSSTIPSAPLLSPQSSSLDTESNSNDSAFHTPSFGDEDFSLDSVLSAQKSALAAGHKVSAIENNNTPQLSISCTAQVAVLHPYSTSDQHHPQHAISYTSNNNTAQQPQQQQQQQSSYIQTPSPDPTTNRAVYNGNSSNIVTSGSSATSVGNLHYGSGGYNIGRYSHQPQYSQQQVGSPDYNNPTVNNSVNRGTLGVGYSTSGSYIQQQQQYYQQQGLSVGVGYNSNGSIGVPSIPYGSSSGYTASHNSSSGGSNNNPQFPPHNFLDIPDISDNSGYYYQQLHNQSQQNHHQYQQPQQHHYQQQQHPHHHPQHHLLTTVTPAYQLQQPSRLGYAAMTQREPILSTMDDESRSLAYSAAGISPEKNSSDDSDDNIPVTKLAKVKVNKRKRGGAAGGGGRGGGVAGANGEGGKKPRTPKKRRKKDPNEPVKPVSAYAMFFRDTQAAIKSENPKATFGEVSKIVASMWDTLGDETKTDYKQKTEIAKKEYLQKLATYRASLVSQGVEGCGSTETSPNVSPERNTHPDVAVPAVVQSNTNLQSQIPAQTVGETENPIMTKESRAQNSVADTAVSPPHQDSPQEAEDEVRLLSTESAPIKDNAVDRDIENKTKIPDEEKSTVTANSFYGKNMRGCTRCGCDNTAVDNPLWDKEYCSNQCVVEHCRDVFNAWVATRSGYASVN